MGQLDSGQVVSLMFLMPVLWKLYGSILEYTLSELLIYCAVKVLVFELKVSTAAILITIAGVMMFWVFRLGHLVGWQFKFWNKTTRTVRVRRRLEARKQRTRHFRGRSLRNRRVVAIWNRNRIVTRRYTPQDRQHSRWRRRKRKLKHRRIFKRRVLDREELSKELYKKRKLLHQRNQQRKFNSSEEVQFKSSEEAPVKSTEAARSSSNSRSGLDNKS